MFGIHKREAWTFEDAVIYMFTLSAEMNHHLQSSSFFRERSDLEIRKHCTSLMPRCLQSPQRTSIV